MTSSTADVEVQIQFSKCFARTEISVDTLGSINGNELTSNGVSLHKSPMECIFLDSSKFSRLFTLKKIV